MIGSGGKGSGGDGDRAAPPGERPASRPRPRRRLGVDLPPAARFLGRLVLLLAATQLLPALVALLYGEVEVSGAFVLSGGLAALGGGALAWWGRGAEHVYRREGILVVVGGWVLASLFGALPYLLTGTLGSPVDALFEAASGFTTTGATVLPDIEAASRGVLFWRCFTQWLGGMGIIVLFVALLPELGPGARFLYKLEVPGPTAEALKPRIRDTAGILWRLYLGLTVAQTTLLMLVGLDLYDALTHTFTTLSTGGFSPENESIAAFGPAVHLVIIAFMVVAGGNFSLYFGLRRRSGGWNLLRDPEFRIYLTILGGASLVVATSLLTSGTYDHPGRALLDAAFQVVSVATTTGFATADFDLWPHFTRILLVVLMFIGGCAGSTSGSVKVMRVVIGIKTALREVRLIFSPSSVIAILVGKKPVPEGVVRSVAGFLVLFLVSWAGASVLLTLRGHDPVTAATAAIATLGNIGPGLAEVGPVRNFTIFGAPEKLLMILLMWAGRLEMYAIVALMTVRFWKR